MRKIEGLKFLQKFFPDECVDCVFVTENEPLDPHDLGSHAPQIFRVRSGRKSGSELGSPQRTCRSTKEVERFIQEALASDTSLEFVIHRVDQSFFEPDFVGTIALFEKVEPMMVIDLQAVSKMLVAGMDSGTRPRDWKVVATYIYPFCRLQPRVHLVDPSFQSASVSGSLLRLWRIGREIDGVKKPLNGQPVTALQESVTRFNIYPNGTIMLDDHRNVASFG
ncbi:MAG: hypothetical protein Q7R80_03465 [bacterium]|nr:hypothetical protein [bacterium]